MNIKSIKQETKDRLNPKTTGSKWKKVRNIAGVVSVVGSLVIAAPVALPATAAAWVTWITLASGIIAGRAHLDKSKK